MRILHVTSKPYGSTYGGLEIYLRYLLPNQVKYGDEIHILSIFFDGNAEKCEFVDRQEEDGVKIHELLLPGKFASCSERKYNSLLSEHLREAIADINPDLCHCHHGFATQTISVCRKMGIKSVYTIHCSEIFCLTGLMLKHGKIPCDGVCDARKCLSCCADFLPLSAFWRLFLKILPRQLLEYCEEHVDNWPFVFFFTPLFRQTRFLSELKGHLEILNTADAIIAPSHAVEALAKRQSVSLENVHVILHGIPNVTPLPYPRIVADKTVEFYYVGRICFYKGIHVLLEAFSKLRHSNWRLHLIGEPFLGIEKAYADKLKREFSDRRIIWHGRLSHEQMSEVIVGCHAMIHPAMYFEIFGLAVSEALAWGRPVIATECGGPESQIRDGENGWLVKRNDISALQSRLDGILANPDCLARLHEKCLVDPLSKHLENMRGLYSSLVEPL